jgi:hypothetical protein
MVEEQSVLSFVSLSLCILSYLLFCLILSTLINVTFSSRPSAAAPIFSITQQLFASSRLKGYVEHPIEKQITHKQKVMMLDDALEYPWLASLIISPRTISDALYERLPPAMVASSDDAFETIQVCCFVLTVLFLFVLL